MNNWQTRRILILGTTYPSYSRKYTEVVCTGGVFEDTLEMVRLHPVPHRYLEPANRFKAFQYITAKVTKHDSDPRPESYRIEPNSIEPQEIIPSTNSNLRIKFLEASPHFCSSVEELKGRNRTKNISLGIVRPKEILDWKIVKRPKAAKTEWERKERDLLSQKELFGQMLKPIDFPEAFFKVTWKCIDKTCTGHTMKLLQWGIHELYRKYKDRPDGHEKVIQKMRSELDHHDREIYLFLGNYRDRQYNFGLMDSYSPKKERQLSLI